MARSHKLRRRARTAHPIDGADAPGAERRHTWIFTAPRTAWRYITPRFTHAAKQFRRYFDTLSIGGMIMALLFFCFSMTPSLLPRAWYLQGIASGVAATTGYAVGVIVAWILRKFGFRPLQHAHQRRMIVRVLRVGAILLVPTFGLLGAFCQYQVRIEAHAESSDPNYYALVLLIAFVLGRALLSFARILRSTGVHKPLGPERSGSPASLVRWDDLGREGRTFIGSGPSAADISSSSGSPAMSPIRVYAGLRSAANLAAESDLVVRELERTGAFDRAVLVVATTTGRGWVNEVAAAAIEHMWGGDTAIAAMQYSFLPSPVAFLSDRETPPEAGAILFAAIHQAWDGRAAKHRPKPIVMGESLGSYGSQGAFASLADVTSTADGAVWAGTPNFTSLWSAVTAGRDPDSPQQIPRVGRCATVCFETQSSGIPAVVHPRVIYLQHVNDPIVWWSPDLLLRRPAWLAEPALQGRIAAMTYIPLVTFWQVTMDLVFSTDMPSGYGHDYALDYVSAFATVLPPPGWTSAETTRLRAHLVGVPTGG